MYIWTNEFSSFKTFSCHSVDLLIFYLWYLKAARTARTVHTLNWLQSIIAGQHTHAHTKPNPHNPPTPTKPRQTPKTKWTSMCLTNSSVFHAVHPRLAARALYIYPPSSSCCCCCMGNERFCTYRDPTLASLVIVWTTRGRRTMFWCPLGCKMRSEALGWS